MVKKLSECLIYILEEDWKQLYLIYNGCTKKENSEMYLGDVMINDPKNPLSYKDEGALHSPGKSERPMGAPEGDAMWKRCLWSPQ